MATEWERELDPYDSCEFEMDFTPVLEAPEAIASFDVEAAAEAAAAGLVVGSVGDSAPVETDPGVIRLHLTIDPAKRASAAFQGNGTLLAVLGSITTDAIPPRAFRREFRVRVKPL